MINSCLGGNEFNQIVSSLKARLSSTSETESGAEGRDGQGLNEIRTNRKEAGFALEPLPPGYVSRWDDNRGHFRLHWTPAVQTIQVCWTALTPSFEGSSSEKLSHGR